MLICKFLVHSNCLSLKGFLKVMELHFFSKFRPLFYTEVFASFGQIIAKSRNERILSKYIDFGLWISRFTILTSLYVYISSTLYYDIVKIHHIYLASKGKNQRLLKISCRLIRFTRAVSFIRKKISKDVDFES